MIQRVQTLFLLGAVIISIVLFFTPLSEKTYVDPTTASEVKMVLNIDKSVVIQSDVTNPEEANYLLLVLNLLILAASIFIIFKYKNRNSQLRLCMLTTLLTMVLLVLIFYYSEKMGLADVKAHYLAGVYLAATQVFMVLAARRFIRKDEMMVRAADRIR